MNWNNESNGQRMVFDIETYPLDDAAEYLIEPIEAPANYSKPETIAKYIAEKSATRLEKCAVDANLCRIVCLGIWPDNYLAPEVVSVDESQESSLLEWFWNEAADRHLVGFNCLAFDLPVLMRRSLYLGVQFPAMSLNKYNHPEFTDLQLVMDFNGTMPWHGLSFYAKRFGVEVNDDLTGADIGRLVAEGKWNDVRDHCLADVRKTAAVAERCGVFALKLAATGAF